MLTAECGAAWLAIAPGETLIRKVHNHDPQQEDFTAEELPALFCWRADPKPQHFEDEHYGDESTIDLLWVFPPTASLTQSKRRSIALGLSRALHKALGPLNGRHPAWVVAGDTDPFAARYGSSLLDWGSFRMIEIDSVRSADIPIHSRDTTVNYHGVFLSLKCQEEFVTGDSFDGFPTLITINQQTTDGDVGFVQTIQTFPAAFASAFDEAFG